MSLRSSVGSDVPDPWAFLARDLPDVTLVRERIREPGRYYDDRRIIVLRSGLDLHVERRYLWHEIVHALRRDTACDGWARHTNERSVEREAAQRAMPLSVLEQMMSNAVDWHDFADRLKVPESWVRYRIEIAHPAERAILERACRWESTA